MNKHTPGPWRATPYSSIVGVAIYADGAPNIAGVRGERHTALANAHLIVAAPDLLEVAQRYARECPCCFGKGEREHTFETGVTVNCQHCSDARAAIKKALGQ